MIVAIDLDFMLVLVSAGRAFTCGNLGSHAAYTGEGRAATALVRS